MMEIRAQGSRGCSDSIRRAASGLYPFAISIKKERECARDGMLHVKLPDVNDSSSDGDVGVCLFHMNHQTLHILKVTYESFGST